MNFQVFLPIEKVDKAKRTISGYASTSALDSDGEMVSLKAIKAALPDYMRWANIREMHKLSAVGTAQEAHTDDKGLFITAKITDDAAWKKVQEGVYKGFSIGGQKLAKTGNIITEIDLSEISVVDRPANPECKFDVVKAHKAVAEAPASLVKVRAPKTPAEVAIKALAKLAKGVSTELVDTGAAGDKPKPAKVLPEPSADEFKAAKKAKKMAKKKAKAEAMAEAEKAEKAKAAEALTKNAQSLVVDGESVLSPWLTLGGSSALVKVAVKAPEAEPEFLTLAKGKKLAKGMNTVGSLAYAFGSLRDAQRSLKREGRGEKDSKDSGFADELGKLAQQLAEVISKKASHEGGEAVDMTDIDDQYVNDYLANLGKANTMTIANDPLGAAILGLLAKAAAPTAKDCIGKAKDAMKESKKAKKAAMEDMEKAHDMVKANYLAKAKKAKGDPDPEFNAEDCMKAIHSAHASMAKAMELDKSARVYLAKAESMVGQTSESPTTGNEFYEVPGGVDHLGRNPMVTAGPGTKGGSGMPPEYDSITPYPGKAGKVGDLAKAFADKNGMVPMAMAQLLAKMEKLEGENEILANMQTNGRRRPHAFNPTTAFGKGAGFTGAAGDDTPDISTIFKGVNVGAIGSGNEQAHKLEAGKAVGNYLLGGFGKSIMDADFKGLGGGANG